MITKPMAQIELELRETKRVARRAAKELLYPKSVRERISNATSTAEVDRIMVNARKMYL